MHRSTKVHILNNTHTMTDTDTADLYSLYNSISQTRQVDSRYKKDAIELCRVNVSMIYMAIRLGESTNSRGCYGVDVIGERSAH